eukprot:TRINITY_DN1535_c0_g1_i1.p2 TRINITY_DN1535_c0_g1~~TRINITY_DN1535_c0_g1_i1.p2  ORF type:complete len:156 (+),score=19.69 TRINITY_DN1535_c0_g1_i1:40-468(+)
MGIIFIKKMNLLVLKDSTRQVLSIIMKSYFCVIYGTPVMPMYANGCCMGSKKKDAKECSINPAKLPTLEALKKTPINIRAQENIKFQYPTVRQPSLVTMTNSTLFFGRRRFNYFILMSVIMAVGGFALLLQQAITLKQNSFI